MTDNLKMKTIKIEFIEGVAEGIRRAEFTTQLMRVLVVPKSKKGLIASLPEKEFQAVYLMVGEDEQGAPVLYIGRTRRMASRINEHDRNGRHAFWKNILYFITRDNSFNSTEIEYLEWLLIKKASETGNYCIDNHNDGCKDEPQVGPGKRADFVVFYNQIVELLAALGYGTIFNKIQIESDEHKTIYRCNARGSNAKMVIRDDDYYVLKDSSCPKKMTSSGTNNTFIASTRERLQQTGILQLQDEKLVFTQDYKFTSPSGAAGVVAGNPMNGWNAWKNGTKTLDECERQFEG